MPTWLPFLVIFLPPLLAVAGAWLGGFGFYLTPVIVLVALPLLDLLWGEAPAATIPLAGPSTAHRLLLHATIPAAAALLLWAAWLAPHLPAWQAVGLMLSVGVCQSLYIPVAHELVHKLARLDRALGKALLFHAGYMHFAIEHVIGHHGKVGTAADPATARLGESFYAFYPRAVLGGWLSAWRLEAARLERLGLGRLHWRNQMAWFTALPLAFAGSLAWAWGPWAAGLYVGQAVLAFSLLELVSYVEHYGLVRAAVPGGGIERVAPAHSWSSCRRLSNMFMVNLQFHADHHMNALRPYQSLCHIEDSPLLPTSYGGMAMLALVPPLFRRVMDPLVARAQAQPVEELVSV